MGTNPQFREQIKSLGQLAVANGHIGRSTLHAVLEVLDGKERSKTTNAPAMPDEGLTAHEICRQLRISRRTLTNWNIARILVPARIGARTLRYRPADVATLLATTDAPPAHTKRAVAPTAVHVPPPTIPPIADGTEVSRG